MEWGPVREEKGLPSAASGQGSEAMVPPCPPWLLLGIYVLYLGLPTTASVPLFADIDWLHEGERLGTVQIILDGGLPYRDVYFAHGIFPEVIRPWLAFKILGESIAADRLLGLLLGPMAYVAAVFYVWKVFPSTTWRIAGLIGFTLYPLLLIPRHIIVFLTMGVLTAWVYEQEKRTRLVTVGALTSLAYVASTMEQATFLLGTVLVFPVCLAAEQILLGSAGSKGWGALSTGLLLFGRMVAPLWGGLLLGLLPFLGYLEASGTIQAFCHDFITRILTDVVTKRDPYPDFTPLNISWYAVPLSYVCLAVAILFRVRRLGDQRWTPIIPTLLFGLLSFVYTMRGCCPTYGKLAVVSFPFIVVFMYVLMILKGFRRGEESSSTSANLSGVDRWLLTLVSVGAVSLLIHALTRDWSVKQIAPQIIFPSLALALLATVVAVFIGWIKSRPWREGLVIACPLALLIVGTWFYNDAKPQILAAQVKKPKLVKDIRQLAATLAMNGGRLTREQPAYLHDQTLPYLKTAYRDGKRVVILATGAGVYYFQAGVSPPNRFPEVYHAMADGPAVEVVEGLDRTKADLLVACRDEGRAVTGWPMNPMLANFIAANYVDSGRRLNSKLLGQGCPFSVWAYREGASGH